jgi:hypothetical protein
MEPEFCLEVGLMRYSFEKRYEALNGVEYYQWKCAENRSVVRIPVAQFWAGSLLRRTMIYRPTLDEHLVTYG